MSKTITACTTLAPLFPGYINASRNEDGSVIVTVRGDPKSVDGAYICGHAHDRGRPGRCTPGDQSCNNYCNLAPEKGKMQDAPARCKQTFCGETVTLRLSADEWANVASEIAGDN
jgi:hypothetical protein